MAGDEYVEKKYAEGQVRLMAYQFADMYFAFCKTLRDEFGREKALDIARRTLFFRAEERARQMIGKAAKEGVARDWQAIHDMSDVPYLGWDASLGKEHCPYGAAWNRRIAEDEWFREFAALYCDVTDTTIAEVFTGDHSHKLTQNVVLGDETCRRRYFPDADVAAGKRTYEK